VKGLIYTVFDEKLGPIAKVCQPADLSPPELQEKVPMMVMNIASNMQEVVQAIATIPIPAFGIKSLVRFIKFNDPQLRGGIGEAALVLLFDEAEDTIYYKYIKQFEEVFNKYAKVAKSFQEKKAPKTHYTTLLGSMSDELRGLLEVLEKEETGGEKTRAFASDESEASRDEFAFKLVILGDGSVGKTSLVLHFTDKAFRQTYLPTIGTNLSEKNVEFDGIKVGLVIWDIAGQAKFNKFRKNFYKGGKGVFIVFDLTSKESFKNVKAWYDDVVSTIGTVPCIVIGNKLDLKEKREVDDASIAALKAELKCDVVLTSALTGDHVNDAFITMARLIHMLNH